MLIFVFQTSPILLNLLKNCKARLHSTAALKYDTSHKNFPKTQRSRTSDNKNKGEGDQNAYRHFQSPFPALLHPNESLDKRW